MIEKDQAIALRIGPTSNTSRYVLWLAREHGKVMTLIKGAQRPKSAFLGQFDLFYTCELLFYARAGWGVHIARECTPLRTRAGFRVRWRACLLASYVADLVVRTLPDGAPAPGLFDWLEGTLDELERSDPPAPIAFRHELRLLDLLGFRPVLDRCAACGRAAPAEARPAFSTARGGLICPACAPQTRDLQPAAPDVVSILASWQRSEDPASARRIRCSRRQTQLLTDLLGAFLRHHLDLDLESRRLAFAASGDPSLP